MDCQKCRRVARFNVWLAVILGLGTAGFIGYKQAAEYHDVFSGLQSAIVILVIVGVLVLIDLDKFVPDPKKCDHKTLP